VDLSGSMAEADMRLGGRPVDRLSAVKAVLSDFLERRRGDRIGLVVFGSQAYTLTPLTTDLDTVREQLADMDIAMAGRETAIGDALALSVRRLREASGHDERRGPVPGRRVVVLLTDGVSNTGVVEPERATALAAAEGVKVHTIGFGREGGAPGLFGMVLPRAQAEIDEAALRAISDATGGRFFRAQDTGTLSEIYAELDRIEAREAQAPPAQLRRDVFHWPLAAAWLVLMVAMVLPGRGERATP
jgi:Ca-activated chloride channel homolog